MKYLIIVFLLSGCYSYNLTVHPQFHNLNALDSNIIKSIILKEQPQKHMIMALDTSIVITMKLKDCEKTYIINKKSQTLYYKIYTKS